MFFNRKKGVENKLRQQLLSYPNVNGVYFGEMTKEGEGRGTGLVVTVNKKLPEKDLHANAIVPKSLEGFPIDVIEIGDIKALDVDRTAEYRPFPMGVSVGHKDITAGTAGVIVKKTDDCNGDCLLLSNNHVLANVNKGKKGDPILQPGPYDGGSAEHIVGELVEYVPIKLADGCSFSNLATKFLNTIARLLNSKVVFSYQTPVIKTNKMNLVDCAIAKLNSGVCSPEIVELGTIRSYGVVGVGEEVWKSGRTTQVKSGKVKSTNFTIQVDMGEGAPAVFTDQILIDKEGFSSGGDSGSAIVTRNQDDSLNLVGLLFAGSDKVTIANKISNVFNALDIHI